MVLTIDIGNTKTKIAVFKGEQLIEHVVIEQINKEYINTLCTFCQQSCTKSEHPSFSSDSTCPTHSPFLNPTYSAGILLTWNFHGTIIEM